MKLLTLFEATKKGKYNARNVYNLYMPNSGEDGVLIGWRGDWPEDHFIEFRGLPYSQWTHDGNDFQRVHDRLAGMRATVLHHNSVVNVLPNMPEHGDIARAIDGGELPEWDKDRAFNESIYDDGSVRASIEEWEEGVVINELSSYDNADGAGRLLYKLKKQYGHITVPNIGERDTESYTFWMRALKRGLADDVYLPNGERATPYSTQAGVTINYNGESKVGVIPQRSMNDSILMMIPTAAMDDSFKRGGSDFYVGPDGSGAAIGKRYEQFQQWISEHDQYDLPEVGIGDNGLLGFTNGRHRYSVFRDAGVDPMPVAMERSSVPKAQKMLGGVIREADYSDGAKTFFHVSNDPLPNGTMLKPQGKEWTPADKILERYRPQGYLSRQESVFLFSSMDDADNVGLTGIHGHVEGYLYEVEPVGGAAGRSWHHVFWYDQIVRELRDSAGVDRDDYEAIVFSNLLREYARRYWEGEDGPESGWEILVPAGKIVDYIGPAEDILYERRMMNEMADPEMIRAAAPKALASLRKELPGISFAHDDFEDETGTEGNDPKWDEKFAVWKEAYAQRRIGMAISALNKGMEFRDGKLLVHRMLSVNAEEFFAGIATQGLGEYWTWSKEDAEAYGGGGGGDDVLITGAVDPKHVDWAQTIHMNAHPNAHDEMEINIPAGAPIKILNVEVNRGAGFEDVDPSLYGGRGRVLPS